MQQALKTTNVGTFLSDVPLSALASDYLTFGSSGGPNTALIDDRPYARFFIATDTPYAIAFQVSDDGVLFNQVFLFVQVAAGYDDNYSIFGATAGKPVGLAGGILRVLYQNASLVNSVNVQVRVNLNTY